ncbi:MAG: peroxidase-related enzyme [Rhodospirillales bacterium]|nr:peroxidase-related enzyme [Rhodospirillales bacterium]
MPQPKHIVKLPPLPDPATLEDDIKKYFAKCQEKLGLIPYVLRAYTANPDKLRAFSRFYNTLMLDEERCKLSKLEREMIAVVVSCANHCYYCLVAHGQAVRELSGDPQLGEMMVMNYRVAELTPRQRAMLDFAWKLTATPHDVGDADREGLHKAGFSEQDIFDIADTAAFFNYTNRVAHALDMMPNPEYHAKNR